MAPVRNLSRSSSQTALHRPAVDAHRQGAQLRRSSTLSAAIRQQDKQRVAGDQQMCLRKAGAQDDALSQASTVTPSPRSLGGSPRTETSLHRADQPATCDGQVPPRKRELGSRGYPAGKPSARPNSSPRLGASLRSQSLRGQSLHDGSEIAAAGQFSQKLNSIPRIGSAHRGHSLHERSQVSPVEEERAFQQALQRRRRPCSPRSLDGASSADSQTAAGSLNQDTPRGRQVLRHCQDGRGVAMRLSKPDHNMPAAPQPLGPVRGEGQFKKGYSAETQKHIAKWHPRLFRYETVTIEPPQSSRASKYVASVAGGGSARAGKPQSVVNSALLHAWDLGPKRGVSPNNIRNCSGGFAEATNYAAIIESSVAERSERLKEDLEFRDLCEQADSDSRQTRSARELHRMKYGMTNSSSVGGALQGDS